MNLAIVVVIGSQILFLVSDLMGRHYMSTLGFKFSSFVTWWFLGYQLIRFVATIGQLYVFSQFELGKTIALFGAAGLVLANLAGYLFLGEVLTLKAYIGVLLATLAFIVIALNR